MKLYKKSVLTKQQVSSVESISTPSGSIAVNAINGNIDATNDLIHNRKNNISASTLMTTDSTNVAVTSKEPVHNITNNYSNSETPSRSISMDNLTESSSNILYDSGGKQ